jgi:hypothetical protein
MASDQGLPVVDLSVFSGIVQVYPYLFRIFKAGIIKAWPFLWPVFSCKKDTILQSLVGGQWT